MPNWKKLIVSGSDATLNSLNVITSITGSDVKIDDWGSISASLSTIQTAGGVNGSGSAQSIAYWNDANTLEHDTDAAFVYIDGTNTGGQPVGRMGLGTTSPNFKLDITGGDLRLESNNGIRFGGQGSNDTYWRIFTAGTSTGTLSIGNSSSTPYLTVSRGSSTTGFVGIGTTTPTTKLTVEGTISGSEVYSNSGMRVQVTDGSFQRAVSPSTSGRIQYGDAGVGDLRFKNSFGNVLTLLSNGNAGIGTTSPQRKLEVRNGSGVGYALLSGTTGAELRFRPLNAYSANGNFGIEVTGTSSSPYTTTMNFTGFHTNETTVMTLKGDNKVGIGSTSPDAPLDILDSQTQAGSTGRATIKTTATTTATSTQSSGMYKIQNYFNLTGTGGSFSNTTHQQVMTTVSSTGTATNLKNHMSRVHTSGNGQIATVAHYNTHAELDGNGTINNWIGYSVAHGTLSQFTNTGHTITNTYGLYIGDLTSGTQTNTPFGVYQLNTDMRNYFAGKVGIGAGSSNPASTVQIGAQSYTGGGLSVSQGGTNNRVARFENIEIVANAVGGSWTGQSLHAEGSNRTLRFTAGGSLNASDTSAHIIKGFLNSSRTVDYTTLHVSGGYNNNTLAADYNFLEITGVVNQSTLAQSGSITGIKYNPSFTNLTGSHTAFHATTGDVKVDSGDIIGGGNFDIFAQYGNRGRITLLNTTTSDLSTQVSFLTNGSQRMVILKGGRVGIGTTLPNTDFHVAGEQLIQKTDNTTAYHGNLNIKANVVAANSNHGRAAFINLQGASVSSNSATTYDFVLGTNHTGHFHIAKDSSFAGGFDSASLKIDRNDLTVTVENQLHIGTVNPALSMGSDAILVMSGSKVTSVSGSELATHIGAATTSALNGYVTLATNQTISGVKTFSDTLILDDGSGASPALRLINEDNDTFNINVGDGSPQFNITKTNTGGNEFSIVADDTNHTASYAVIGGTSKFGTDTTVSGSISALGTLANGLRLGRDASTDRIGLFAAPNGATPTSNGNLYIAPRNINSANGSFILLGQRDSSTANHKGTVQIQAGDPTYHSMTGDIILNFSSSAQFLLDGGTGNASLTGDLAVAGKVTAQEFHTEFVSSSIVYDSGSTKFGDTQDDIHDFTGSLKVFSGSLSFNPKYNDSSTGIINMQHGHVGGGNALHINIMDTGSQSILRFKSDTNGHGDMTFYRGNTARVNIATYWPSMFNPEAYATRGGVVIGTSATSTNYYGLQVATGGASGSLSVGSTLYVSGSRVGIGTALPTQTVQVVGNIESTGSLNITGSLGVEVGGSTVLINNTGVHGRISAGSSFFIGGGNTTLVQFSSPAIPDSDGSHKLGQSNRYWGELYVDKAFIGNDMSHVHTISGSAKLTGSLTITGSLIMSSSTAVGLPGNVTGNLIPTADGAYNLGSTHTKDWNTLYVKYIDIFNERFKLTYSNTTASLSDHTSVGQGFKFTHRGSEILQLGRDGDLITDLKGEFRVSGSIEATGSITLNGDGRHIYFGGTNTFIGERSNSNHLQLRGGGNITDETVYITDWGRMGLGTSNPSAQLHVVATGSQYNIARFVGREDEHGTIRIYSGSFDAAALGYHQQGYFMNSANSSNPNGAFFIRADKGIDLGTAGTGSLSIQSQSANVIIDSKVKVGIGTDDPDNSLHIHTSGATSAFKAYQATYQQFEIKYDNTYHSTMMFGHFGELQYDGNGGYLRLSNKSTQAGSHIALFTSGSERIRITHDGKFGFGTTTPGHLVHISGAAADVKLLLEDGATGAPIALRSMGSGEAELQISTNSRISRTGGDLNFITNAIDQVWYVDNGSTGAMFLSSSGNFGLGTTTPKSKLQVQGTVSASGDIKAEGDITVGNNLTGYDKKLIIKNGANINNIFTHTSASVQNAQLVIKGGNFTHALRLRDSYAPGSHPGDVDYARLSGGYTQESKLTLYTSQSVGGLGSGSQTIIGTATSSLPGNVGIGTATPSQRLHVEDGNVLVQDGYIRSQIQSNNHAIQIQASVSNEARILAHNFNQGQAHDLRIAAKSLDFQVNGNATSSLHLSSSGLATLGKYGSGTYTGTAAYNLQVDSSGKIIETVAGGGGSGTIDGTGVVNRIPLWSDADSIVTSSMTQNSDGGIDINGTDDSTKLRIIPDGSNIGDTATVEFNSRAVVGWTGSAVYLGDGNQSKDIKLQVNTGDIIALTKNTERLRINSTGSVGIGISTPTGSLHIKSGSDSFRYTNDLGDNFDGIELVGGNPTLKLDGAGNTFNVTALTNSFGIYDVTNTNYRLTILNNGNVGIGTTSPFTKFHVNGNTRVYGNFMAGTAAHQGNTPATPVHIKASGTGAVLRIEDSDNANKAYDFLVDEGNGLYIKEESDTRLFIKEGGNVAIGDHSPGCKLHVSGGEVRLEGSTQSTLNLKSTTNSKNNYIIGNSSGDIAIRPNANNNALVVKSTGKVGIGTNSPYNMLHIIESGSTNYQLRITATGSAGNENSAGIYLEAKNSYTQDAFIKSDDNGMTLGTTNNENVNIVTNNTTSSIFIKHGVGQSNDIHFHGQNSTGLFLSASGNVGIGNTNPQYATLQVTGTGLFSGTLQVQNILNLRASTQHLNHDSSAFVTTLTRYTGGSELGLDYDYVRSINATAGGNIAVGHNGTARAGIHISGSSASTAGLRLSRAGQKIWSQEIDSNGKLQWAYRSTEAGSATQHLTLNDTGQAILHQYGSGTHTGTAVKTLQVDSSGNIIEGSISNFAPKVEYQTVSSNIATNATFTLPNSLSYTISSGGYEYLEVFLDGMRLNRGIDFEEISTTSIKTLMSIPAGSVITYKSIT